MKEEPESARTGRHALLYFERDGGTNERPDIRAGGSIVVLAELSFAYGGEDRESDEKEEREKSRQGAAQALLHYKLSTYIWLDLINYLID